MRRFLALLIAVPLVVPALPARSNKWTNVMKLKPGTSVEILLSSGENVSGSIDSASDTGIRLAVPDPTNEQDNGMRTIDRSNIRRVARIVYHPRHLPNQEKWLTIGAVGGGVIGATAGGIADINHGTNGSWLLDGFAGALVGFFASCAALAVVAVVTVARPTYRSKVVYENGSHNS
ncbi:MAG TPA: hypothetical protein VKS44_06000 [Candidatus Acidoferrales bacterium]|nr:hypothetical protein [Candidatus Acidoferrales bacterium]